MLNDSAIELRFETSFLKSLDEEIDKMLERLMASAIKNYLLSLHNENFRLIK